jgi:hypothetical protein
MRYVVLNILFLHALLLVPCALYAKEDPCKNDKLSPDVFESAWFREDRSVKTSKYHFVFYKNNSKVLRDYKDVFAKYRVYKDGTRKLLEWAYKIDGVLCEKTTVTEDKQ